MQPIVACGVPRSGSTLIWQLLRGVFPKEDIPKIHPDIWNDACRHSVVTIRNPLDVVASLFRVQLSRGRKTDGKMTDLDNALTRVRLCFNALPKVLEHPHTLLRYEDFYNDYKVIYDAFEKISGHQVPVYIRVQLSFKYNVCANRKRADGMNNFNEVDEASGIHGEHIGAVVPGHWKKTLPIWALSHAREVCAPLIEKWGYDV